MGGHYQPVMQGHNGHGHKYMMTVQTDWQTISIQEKGKVLQKIG
jgi:hypothetical protein